MYFLKDLTRADPGFQVSGGGGGGGGHENFWDIKFNAHDAFQE